MNLQLLIEQYITYRQTQGERFQTNAANLRAFARAIGIDADITEVRAEQVNVFLAGTGPLTHTWYVRHNVLVGFYRSATSRGHVATAPLPVALPKRPVSFVPYICSHEELRRLVDVARTNQERRSCIEPDTLDTIVLLLYGTGLRVGEAVRLDRQDVDLGSSLLTVRQSKFYKSRLVPFSQQLQTVLTRYSEQHPATICHSGQPAAFFTTHAGGRVNLQTLQVRFRRICHKAGICRAGASYQPRLQGL